MATDTWFLHGTEDFGEEAEFVPKGSLRETYKDDKTKIDLYTPAAEATFWLRRNFSAGLQELLGVAKRAVTEPGALMYDVERGIEDLIQRAYTATAERPKRLTGEVEALNRLIGKTVPDYLAERVAYPLASLTTESGRKQLSDEAVAYGQAVGELFHDPPTMRELRDWAFSRSGSAEAAATAAMEGHPHAEIFAELAAQDVKAESEQSIFETLLKDVFKTVLGPTRIMKQEPWDALDLVDIGTTIAAGASSFVKKAVPKYGQEKVLNMLKDLRDQEKLGPELYYSLRKATKEIPSEILNSVQGLTTSYDIPKGVVGRAKMQAQEIILNPYTLAEKKRVAGEGKYLLSKLRAEQRAVTESLAHETVHTRGKDVLSKPLFDKMIESARKHQNEIIRLRKADPMLSPQTAKKIKELRAKMAAETSVEQLLKDVPVKEITDEKIVAYTQRALEKVREEELAGALKTYNEAIAFEDILPTRAATPKPWYKHSVVNALETGKIFQGVKELPADKVLEGLQRHGVRKEILETYGISQYLRSLGKQKIPLEEVKQRAVEMLPRFETVKTKGSEDFTKKMLKDFVKSGAIDDLLEEAKNLGVPLTIDPNDLVATPFGELRGIFFDLPTGAATSNKNLVLDIQELNKRLAQRTNSLFPPAYYEAYFDQGGLGGGFKYSELMVEPKLSDIPPDARFPNWRGHYGAFRPTGARIQDIRYTRTGEKVSMGLETQTSSAHHELGKTPTMDLVKLRNLYKEEMALKDKILELDEKTLRMYKAQKRLDNVAIMLSPNSEGKSDSLLIKVMDSWNKLDEKQHKSRKELFSAIRKSDDIYKETRAEIANKIPPFPWKDKRTIEIVEKAGLYGAAKEGADYYAFSTPALVRERWMMETPTVATKIRPIPHSTGVMLYETPSGKVEYLDPKNYHTTLEQVIKDKDVLAALKAGQEYVAPPGKTFSIGRPWPERIYGKDIPDVIKKAMGELGHEVKIEDIEVEAYGRIRKREVSRLRKEIKAIEKTISGLTDELNKANAAEHGLILQDIMNEKDKLVDKQARLRDAQKRTFTTIPAIRLTPQMRKDILKKGFIIGKKGEDKGKDERRLFKEVLTGIA